MAHPLGLGLIEIYQADELSATINYQRLSHIRKIIDHILKLLRIDILPRRAENHGLATSLYEDVSVFVDYAKVACPHETVFGEEIGGSLRVLIIAYADIVSFGLDFSNHVLRILGVDADCREVHGLSAGAWDIFRIMFVCEKRAGLSHSVAYGIVEADSAEPVLDLRIEGGASHDELLDLASESGLDALAHLAQNQVADSWNMKEELDRLFAQLRDNSQLENLLHYERHRDEQIWVDLFKGGE